jgi:hypothetical protein
MGAWGGDDFVLSFVYPLLSAVFFEIRPAPLVFGWDVALNTTCLLHTSPVTIENLRGLHFGAGAQQAPNNYCAF